MEFYIDGSPLSEFNSSTTANFLRRKLCLAPDGALLTARKAAQMAGVTKSAVMSLVPFFEELDMSTIVRPHGKEIRVFGNTRTIRKARFRELRIARKDERIRNAKDAERQDQGSS